MIGRTLVGEVSGLAGVCVGLKCEKYFWKRALLEHGPVIPEHLRFLVEIGRADRF